MKHRVLEVLLVLASLAPGVAGAQSPARPCRSETAAILQEDANEDGQVTLLEARAAALALFEHLDGDGDGQVTRAEAAERAPRWREQRSAARFGALDRDRDGTLSRAEARLPARRFARLDRDRDGRLARAELDGAAARGSGRASDTAALRSMFWRRDMNGDGRVTRSEMLAATDRRFMRKDRDRDGVLTGLEGRVGSARPLGSDFARPADAFQGRERDE